MQQHRYHIRSKGAVPEASADDDASEQQAVPSSCSSATATQVLGNVDSYEQGSSESPSDDMGIETVVPGLFLLPPEIQIIIYEYAVVEPQPIVLPIWGVHTAVGFPRSKPKARPSLLAVCKYLRRTVAPIYFSGNDFSTRVLLNALNVIPLRHIWGDDVKYIRSLTNIIEVHIALEYDPTRPWGERVSIHTVMKILPDGTLVMKRRTYESKMIPYNEEMCRCHLEAVAAASSAAAKDSRRLFEIVRQCVLDHEKRFEAKTCDLCKLSCLSAWQRYGL